jgi:hypothetical protein
VGSEIVSKAQHCRAEVFLTGFGWVPVDPALWKSRRANLPSVIQRSERGARRYSALEMNWLAYNFAHDIELPGSSGPKVGFLMYPQAEVDGERLDSLEPDALRSDVRTVVR